MSVLELANFSGILPRYSDTNLPPNQATKANNVKLTSGEIRPWQAPVKVHQCTTEGVQSIYRLRGNEQSIWLEFDSDVDVCYSPLADKTGNRIYYTEKGVGKKTNYDMAIDGEGAYPRKWYYMGTPRPAHQPSGVANSTSEQTEDIQNVVYVYTYVSEFEELEEESAPSEASELITTTYDNYSVTISFNKDSGGNSISPVVPTDHLNITKIRLYRVVTGTETATYMEVDELPLNPVTHQLDASGTSTEGVEWANYTYIDTRTAEQLSKELDSLKYDEPPEGLTGLVSMPNGFLAGFKNNEVYFSEPFLPHAWPADYMLTVDAPIVGLGVYGNTLVVCTERHPYTISGTHPSSVTQEKQPMFQPCMSKRSIAYDQYGVLYASPYGLVAMAGGQMDVFTRPIITKDEWAKYYPKTMIATMYDNLYMCSYSSELGTGMLIFSRSDKPELVGHDFHTRVMHIERQSGRLFCVEEKENAIYEMDADEINAGAFEWVSKRFYDQYWTNYSAIRVDADYTALERVRQWEADREAVKKHNEQIAAALSPKSFGGCLNDYQFNQGRVDTTEYEGEQVKTVVNQFVGGSRLKLLPTKPESVYVNVAGYIEGDLAFSETFTSAATVRLPPKKGDFWQIAITGNLNVRSVRMATTMQELAAPM
jgi:hypothetical protein